MNIFEKLKENDAMIDEDLHQVHSRFVTKYRSMNCKLILDCGSARGVFALRALQEWPDADLLAIDPNITELQKLISQAHQDNVMHRIIVLAAAIWNISGEILPFGYYAGCGNYGQVGLVFSQTIPLGLTPTVTLEQVVNVFGQREIDLIKMDIEGAEHVIFPSTTPDILRRAKYWHIDEHNVGDKVWFGPQWNPVKVYGTLSQAGFVCIDPPNVWARNDVKWESQILHDGQE